MHPGHPAGFAATPVAAASGNTSPHGAIPRMSTSLQPMSPALSVSQGRSTSGGVEGHSLDDIPLQYTIDKLHSLGRYYWHKPETTDCCIHVPMDARRFSRTPNFDNPGNPNAGVFTSPPLDHRRGSEPVSADAPTLMKLHLHQMYLSTQSSLFRSLLSGSSALGLHSGGAPTSAPRMDHSPAIPVASSSRPRQNSMALLNARMPRLLPSNTNYPIVYLPLPDPQSFPHIIHYMYHGSPAFMHEALDKNLIRWEGVMRNIEYLGLWDAPQRSLKMWLLVYREHRRNSYANTVMEESEEDDSESDGESSDEWSGSDEWDLEATMQSISELKMTDPFAACLPPDASPGAYDMTQGPLEVRPVAS